MATKCGPRESLVRLQRLAGYIDIQLQQKQTDNVCVLACGCLEGFYFKKNTYDNNICVNKEKLLVQKAIARPTCFWH